MIDPTMATAREIAGGVRARQLRAVEVARAALDRIERLDPALRAFITVTGEAALEAAERVDRDVAAGKDLPLAGVPLAVKDSFWTRGVRTTAGSKVLAGFVPDRDATAVARLKAAGCVPVGKASMHEFAYGFTSQNPHYGDCRNPWDPARIPGGSSGGAAVAVATGMAPAALGGDTGGSVRLPAALCGVVGLKVTYGRVSRSGGVPLSWSMDTVGPMARTVGDAAALLHALAGPDPGDPTTLGRPALPGPVPADGDAGPPLNGVRLGLPHNHFFEAMEPAVSAAVLDAVQVLKDLGASLVEVPFPHLDAIRGAHRAILFSEAAAAHEHLVRTRAADFSPEVLLLLKAGLFLDARRYLAAQRARRRIIADVRAIWKGFDLLVTPTSPIAATPIGATTVRLAGADRPLVRAYLDHTLPFNLTGQPALSVPCGFTPAGLPVGLQLVGRPFDEALLLRVGAAYEAATAWHTRRPPDPGRP
jgi:aspartyl-tRNA(Asn)/glutamyl-tRNA(Gln) amidotransferase subunit A